MRSLYLLLVLASAAMFACVLGSEGDEITLHDLAFFLSAMIAVFAIQFVLLILLNAFFRSPQPTVDWRLRLAVAILFALNSYFFVFLATDPDFRAVVHSFIAGAIFYFTLRFPIARRGLVVFAGAIMVMSLGQYGYARVSLSRPAHASTTALPLHGDRNVYVIGFETLLSPYALRELYDAKALPHVDYLRSAGFRVLDRSYSARDRTIATYAQMLEFGRQLDRDDLSSRRPFARGNSTFDSFRGGGYKIQFLYKSNYFGINESLVDYFYPGTAFYACDNLTPAYMYFLCHKKVARWVNRTFYDKEPINYKAQIKHLPQRVEAVASSKAKWLTINHIGYPFHTPLNHRYDDEEGIAKFKKKMLDALPTIADLMSRAVGRIVERDPEAVIIVMGDHGAQLTRRMPKELQRSGTSGMTFEKIVEDQHGAMLAVYPADFCINRLPELSSSRALMKNIIHCLNGDDTPSEDDEKLGRTVYHLQQSLDVIELQNKK